MFHGYRLFAPTAVFQPARLHTIRNLVREQDGLFIELPPPPPPILATVQPLPTLRHAPRPQPLDLGLTNKVILLVPSLPDLSSQADPELLEHLRAIARRQGDPHSAKAMPTSRGDGGGAHPALITLPREYACKTSNWFWEAFRSASILYEDLAMSSFVSVAEHATAEERRKKYDMFTKADNWKPKTHKRCEFYVSFANSFRWSHGALRTSYAEHVLAETRKNPNATAEEIRWANSGVTQFLTRRKIGLDLLEPRFEIFRRDTENRTRKVESPTTIVAPQSVTLEPLPPPPPPPLSSPSTTKAKAGSSTGTVSDTPGQGDDFLDRASAQTLLTVSIAPVVLSGPSVSPVPSSRHPTPPRSSSSPPAGSTTGLPRYETTVDRVAEQPSSTRLDVGFAVHPGSGTRPSRQEGRASRETTETDEDEYI